MKRFITLQNLLFYLLTLVLFFLLGTIGAGLAGASKNQGLASGAIVLGYGVIVGFTALILAIISIYFIKASQVKLLNIIFAAIIIIIVIILSYRYQSRNQENEKNFPVKNHTAVSFVSLTNDKYSFKNRSDSAIGMGMCRPRFFENKVIYFYGYPNLGKSILEHLPQDSIVFRDSKFGTELVSAPPWFVPAHLKLDYEILYLRVVSVQSEFIQVIVNEIDGRTAYMNRSVNEIKYWPDFLLSVNSIELLDQENNPIRVKPLLNAGLVSNSYEYLKPISIYNDWINIELLDSNLNLISAGWIRWFEDGKLLIKYSLLS